MSSTAKYALLLLACAAAGMLTGHWLHTPPTDPPLANRAPSAASPASTTTPAKSPDVDDRAVSDLIQTLEKTAQPGTDFNDLEAVLLDGIEHFSSADLAALTTSLAGQTNSRLQNLTNSVLGYWAAKDIAAARNWLLKRPDTERSIRADAVAATWVKQDAAGFADWLVSLSPEEMQSSGKVLLGEFLTLAGPKLPDRALAVVASLRDVSERERAFSSFFAAWAKRDPAGAAARVLQLETTASKAQSVEAVAAAWAEKDAHAAWAWITSIQDAVLSLKAQQAFIQGLAKTDPAAAAERVAELPLTQETANLLNKLGREWSRKDPQAAVQWAANIDDETMRERIGGQIQMGAAFSGDFETATRLLIEHADKLEPSEGALGVLMRRAARRYGANLGEYIERFPENYRVAAVLAAGESVSGTQPGFVEEWALRQPEGDARSQLLARVAGARHEKDPEAAVTWAKALPDGDSKRAAASVIVRNIYRTSPERSVEALRALTPPDALESELMNHLQSWLFDVPKSARQWIENTGTLTAAQKRALLENE